MNRAIPFNLTTLTPAAEAALMFWLAAHAQHAGAEQFDWPEMQVGLARIEDRVPMGMAGGLAAPMALARRRDDYAIHYANGTDSGRRTPDGQGERDLLRWIEDGLRNLSDYAYLGEHPMAGWKLVERRLPAGSRTTLDRGKVVHEVLVEAIEKFRPAGKRPGDLPPKVWQAYLILHEAYVENTPNREVMARLNLSEGTFNRRRRAALRALVRLLEDLEAA